MPTIDIISPQGAATGTVELPAEIFDVAVNVPLIHQVVVAQLAAARQGTHATKTRADVRRSSPAVAPSTARSRVTTVSAPPRR